MFDGAQFDAVYVSPLRRARKTADMLRVRLQDLPANEVRDELREIDLTAWEGMPFTEVRARFAEDYRLWKLYPERLRMLRQNTHRGAAASFSAADEYAPALEVRDRARSFLDYIENQHTGDKLLVIAHGGFNRSLILTALGLPVKKLHTIAQSNCGVSVIKRRNSSKWSLMLLI